MPVNMSLATSLKEKVQSSLCRHLTDIRQSELFMAEALFFLLSRNSVEQLIHLAYVWRHGVVRLAVLADAD